MPSNLHPDESYRQFEEECWDECEDCGGTGSLSDVCQCEEVQDTCACETPKPMSCPNCMGDGGFEPDPSADEQALWEADKENY